MPKPICLALFLSAAALPANALSVMPPSLWETEQRRAVLDTTRTLRLAPDLSALTAGEQQAVKQLLAAGELAQAIYERQVHPQARAALADLDTLPGARTATNCSSCIGCSRARSAPPPTTSASPSCAWRRRRLARACTRSTSRALSSMRISPRIPGSAMR